MLKTISFLILTLFILILIYLFYPIFIVTGKPLLIVNMWNDEELPRNFRMSIDPVHQKNGLTPSLIGLKELKTSGSAQFSEKSLSTIITKIPSKEVTIIDLRQESHGFINGIAVSWYTERDWANKGKTLSEIVEDENRRLKKVLQWPIAIVYSRKFPIPLWVKNTETESEIVSALNLGYLRLPVTDHMRPSNHIVDQFVNFINTLPKESLWLHYHCAAGEGRTTTFLAMYDMMRNATKVKIEDIFLRQYLLGGINFLNEKAEDWKKKYVEERKAFLYQFFAYCQQNPLFQKSWTTWLAEQKEGTKNGDSSQRDEQKKEQERENVKDLSLIGA